MSSFLGRWPRFRIWSRGLGWELALGWFLLKLSGRLLDGFPVRSAIIGFNMIALFPSCGMNHRFGDNDSDMRVNFLYAEAIASMHKRDCKLRSSRLPSSSRR